MVTVPKNLILWKGPKHSGKTTTASNLVETARKAGFNIAGLLAFSLYTNGKLIGFDAFDLNNNTRIPLARCNNKGTGTGFFSFIEEGLRFGNAALDETANKYADLVIVDEFGPFELDGRIWREAVDLLLSNNNRLILLVVREELVERIRRLYAGIPSRKFAASDPESVSKVIDIPRNRQKLFQAAK